MESILNPTDLARIRTRIDAIGPNSARQWGKMDAAQMFAHCCVPLELAASDRPAKQVFLGKLLAWMVKKKFLGTAPFDKNMPTDKSFLMTDPRDLEKERARLRTALQSFVDRGPAYLATRPHLFFGRLTGAEWGTLMWKHLDHHLRQFGS